MRFYNTLTRSVDEFTPLNDSLVTLYTCGPTVYSMPHIGNFVSYIRWDILVRSLQLQGYTVKRVMNITDVGHLTDDADDGEDKMLKGARREGLSAWEIAKKYTHEFMTGMEALGLITPTYTACATEYIQEQIDLVKVLEDKKYTYNIDDGVYFDTSKFPTYAEFARLDLEKLQEGARVEFNPQKRNASDFALWKFSPKNERRDMEWESPWGKGFPGWHVECSAMAMKLLGKTIDIHTGGIDHIPVHHTNEIAQSEAATGTLFSRFWLHNNFLLVNGTKISKSLGNVYTLHDLAEKGFSAQVFKLFVLQSHYRSESNFTWENLESAKNRLAGFTAIADLLFQPNPSATPLGGDFFDNARTKLLEHLANDLDTPMFLSDLNELFSQIENAQGLTPDSIDTFSTFLSWIDDALGTQLAQRVDLTDEQKNIMRQRSEARENKNWTESDRLREVLQSQGIVISDKVFGQVWSKI